MSKIVKFFSCKPGKNIVVRNHRLRSAAMAAAGEYGQIWDTGKGRRYQVNRSSNGEWRTYEPEAFLSVDLEGELRKLSLI